jgi:hypothetical protein
MPRRAWKETTVRLSRATATLFDGPGGDWLLVVTGKRRGEPRVTRQAAPAAANKGGRRHGS